MQSADVVRYTLLALAAARMRSALTVLGIGVGIATVVLLTAIGTGVREFVLAEFTQFGTHLLSVLPGKNTTFGGGASTISNVRPLQIADAQAIRRLEAVVDVVPVVQGNAAIEYGARSRRTVVLGVGNALPRVWNTRVSTGRFLPGTGDADIRAYAVLGAKLRTELFGRANPLGERIRIGGDRYRVIGVMEARGQMLGFDLDDTIYIPIVNALRLFDRESLMEIDVLYDPDARTSAIEAAIKRLLIERHGREDFSIITQDRMLEVLGKVLNVLTLGVAALGGISLVVGAVGVVTIMTIAVAERRAEIGLLRALGAPRHDVLRLFLAEAGVLGLCGGLLGCLVALGTVLALRTAVPALPLSIAWAYVGASLAISVALGALAGLAPALQATRLDPLEALRAE
jgi:putative ABC transport system permease protein